MDEPTGHAAAASRAERCADRLRSQILSGELLPGQHLDEVALGARLGVSRNTLREAFRQLGVEELVHHEPHRGVFVRSVDAQASREIYAVRRQLELGALDEVAARHPKGLPAEAQEVLARMAEAVVQGERAREADDWQAVGTANAHFHLAVVDLAGNRVASRFMRILGSLTRLRFLTLGDARVIHENFLDDNRRIFELLRAGQVARARIALEVYLLRADDEFS